MTSRETQELLIISQLVAEGEVITSLYSLSRRRSCCDALVMLILRQCVARGVMRAQS